MRQMPDSNNLAPLYSQLNLSSGPVVVDRYLDIESQIANGVYSDQKREYRKQQKLSQCQCSSPVSVELYIDRDGISGTANLQASIGLEGYGFSARNCDT